MAPPKLAPEPKKILLEAIKKATTDKNFVAWAKKADYPLKNVYGSDAEQAFLRVKKSYEKLTPLIKKNLS